MMTVNKQFLITSGNGKTGRRISRKLTTMGYAVRIASRGANPPFDWYDQQTWKDAFNNITDVYI
ncbi:MAG: NmrA family transcriptional regulator, partial [Chitinophagaceae bacterium]